MANETPHEALLDRRQPVTDVNEHFREAINLLRDVTNYGTNLIIRCFVTGERHLEDAIILGALLRQAVAMFDALEILVANASIYLSQLQERAIFEASLYLDFILCSETKAKATSYYVANLREQRLWACKVNPGSPENSTFTKTMEAFGLNSAGYTEKLQEEGARQIDEIDRILSQEELSDANEALQRYKDKKGIPFEPAWYIPFGPKSVRQIAVALQRLHEYELIYSPSSEVIHSTKYDHHFKFSNGNMHCEPIRHLSSIHRILNVSVTLMIKIYQAVLLHYRPEELPAFRRKYAEDWRSAFLSIKSVNYSYGENTIFV